MRCSILAQGDSDLDRAPSIPWLYSQGPQNERTLLNDVMPYVQMKKIIFLVKVGFNNNHNHSSGCVYAP